MIPVDDPLKCPYAEEWDRKTLADAMENMLWTPGEQMQLHLYSLK